MVYKISNVENDEFIALVFKELETSLTELSDIEIKTIKESNQTKGIDFQSIIILANQLDTLIPIISSSTKEVIIGLLSATIFEAIKAAIVKHKRLEEYSDEKIIEIEITDKTNNKISVKVSMTDYLDGKSK